ncbi:MAG: glycosyltransferase family 39 protein [Clostridiales bacterium]|nr:glycosyltransferase family 39 protein [Clostridiales bacterium]
MFKQEYILQKILLTIAMILILIYAGSFLSEKHGISAYEAENYTIANSSESLGDSPYTWTYHTIALEKKFQDLSYITEFSSIWSQVKNCWNTSDSAIESQTNATGFSNSDWIENSYYNSLLHVNREQTYQFSSVTDKCIATQKAPLYYWLLHFFSSLFDGVGMYQVTFFIHAIVLFFSAFLIFTIGEKYMDSGWAGFAAAIFYGLCMGCFTNLLCTTPYLLASFFMLVCIYLNFSLLRDNRLSLLYTQVMIVANILGNLTDYSYTLFTFLLGLTLCITLLCYHRLKDMLKFICVWISSSLITFFIYPAALLHLSSHFLSLKEKAGVLFASGELIHVFTHNCEELCEQTFSKTALFIGVFILVLIIFAAYFKKRTFNEVYEDWYERLITQDIADMLLIIIGFFYFLAICFINPANPYFVLSTILPILCLVFAYVLYHLGMAILHTEQNSGILGVSVVCLICLFSLKTGTIDYIYKDNAANLDFASTYNKEYCLFLTSDSMSAKDHLLELEKYDHSMVLDTKQLKSLKKNKTFQSLNQVLVYLSNEDYAKGITDVIANYGNFELSKGLYNYRDENGTHIYVYLLQQLGTH